MSIEIDSAIMILKCRRPGHLHVVGRLVYGQPVRWEKSVKNPHAIAICINNARASIDTRTLRKASRILTGTLLRGSGTVAAFLSKSMLRKIQVSYSCLSPVFCQSAEEF